MAVPLFKNCQSKYSMQLLRSRHRNILFLKLSGKEADRGVDKFEDEKDPAPAPFLVLVQALEVYCT